MRCQRRRSPFSATLHPPKNSHRIFPIPLQQLAAGLVGTEMYPHVKCMFAYELQALCDVMGFD